MYTPLNASVYLAAYTGAYGSMSASWRIPTSQNPATYDNTAKAAGAWAESFDTAWAGSAATQFQLDSIADASESTWDGRSPTNSVAGRTASTYTKQVLALIALISAASSYLGGGVTPVQQTDYYVNALTGNDANSGATSLKAIKTLTSLNSRLSGLNVMLPVNVHLETDFASSDPFFLNSFNGTLNVYGTKRTVRTGTITGFTPVNRALNNETRITDAAVLDWTADKSLTTGRRVRVTAGPNINQIAYVAANVGAGVASTDVPYEATLSPFGVSINQGVFAPGDAYVVEDLTGFTVQTLSANGQVSAFPFGGVNFVDVRIDGILFDTMWGNTFVNYVNCDFNVLALVSGDSQTAAFYKCCGRSGLACISGIADVQSGLWGNNPLDGSGIGASGQFGLIRIDKDATCWGSCIKLGTGGICIGVAAAFNAPALNGSGSGLQLGVGQLGIENLPNCSVNLYDLSGPHALYGKGNTEYGVQVGSGSIMTYKGALPTITGADGDFKLGTGGNERAFDDGVAAYTGPIVATWANMPLTIGAGGFNHNAHDVAREAHLMLFV